MCSRRSGVYPLSFCRSISPFVIVFLRSFSGRGVGEGNLRLWWDIGAMIWLLLFEGRRGGDGALHCGWDVVRGWLAGWSEVCGVDRWMAERKCVWMM